MKFKINVSKTFTINGKKYQSTEEMPEEVRRAYEKAMGGAHSSRKNNFVFNGKEYESVEAMPEDVRGLYEKIMNAVDNGEAPGNTDSGPATIASKTVRTVSEYDSRPERHGIEPETASPRHWGLLAFMLLIAVLIYLFVFPHLKP